MLTIKQKKSTFRNLKEKYRKSTKKQKTQILNEFMATTNYNRSYARYLLGTLRKRGRKKKYSLRKRVYDISVFYPLRL